jgi:hypothetical protein
MSPRIAEIGDAGRTEAVIADGGILSRATDYDFQTSLTY